MLCFDPVYSAFVAMQKMGYDNLDCAAGIDTTDLMDERAGQKHASSLNIAAGKLGAARLRATLTDMRQRDSTVRYWNHTE